MKKTVTEIDGDAGAVQRTYPATCQMIHTNRETGEHKECGKPAKYKTYGGIMYFCRDCLDDYMQDATVEECYDLYRE